MSETATETGFGSSVSLYDFFALRAARVFWLFCAFHLVLWSLVPALVYGNLPLDVIELATWGHAWQLGYFKHPPLPSWILEAATLLFGSADWPAYLISQTCILLSFAAVWRLGRQLLGSVPALVAVFLTSLIYFYNYPTPEFNHNVLQIPVWGWMAVFAWQALKKDRIADWLLLGGLVGISVYIKYSMAIFVFVLLAFLIIEPTARPRLRSRGLWLSAFLAFLIGMPHLYWLFANDFITLTYATGRSSALEGIASRFVAPLVFLATQIAHHGGMLLVVALGCVTWPISMQKQNLHPVSFQLTDKVKRRYLLWIALAPVLMTALLSVVAGMEMRPMWAAPMFSFSALALLAVMKTALYKARFRVMVLGWALLYFGVLAAVAGSGLFGSYFIRKPLRMDWPGRAMAMRFEKLWEDKTGVPFRFVGGDAWIAGNVSYYSKERPFLVHLEDFTKSPWAKESDFACAGGLIVWDQKKSGAPVLPSRYQLDKTRISAKGLESFVWKVKDRPFHIGWALQEPDPQSCR
ncbi:glycosyltransferase family 39 protein [uncultured Cohaesibacter sp.]|uniref:glycosyltransferase family 39 protein n=1 Tax=uncultured Cohaesibacter sp. TaxID=1002546 RepID=UPI002931F3F9|nr:glycosyltransferase family 39 protein [uncultured Cohaesibacter sp.]